MTGRWLRQLRSRRPISAQLVAAILSVTILSVLVGSALVFAIRANALLENEHNRLQHIALIAADFSRAPLAFGDRRGAEERLRYLQTIPQALQAYVLDARGEVFAHWRRDGDQPVWAPGTFYPISLARRHFTVEQAVADADRAHGRVVVLADTAALRTQLFEYLGAVLLVVLLVLPLAAMLAYRMQKHVSGSIRHLAAAAQRISREPDLTVRVEPGTNDEIGDLYCAFNAMMDRLQARERERDLAYTELDSIRAQLEDRVALRTEQYRAANQALEREFERLQAAEAEISRALAEKETLLREIHHRVKNNLQVVHSLLSLQIKPGETRDAAALLADARQRVKTIAVVHETLYRSDDLANVSAAPFLEQIADNVARIFDDGAKRIRIVSEVEDVRLDADQAIPVGLIVNELVTNAFKYAFAPQAPGTVRLRLHREEGDNLLLEVSDDGRGLSEGLDFGKATSLGWMLVRALASQLRGDIDLDSGERGTRVRVRFPASD